jgi:hypothetical protein
MTEEKWVVQLRPTSNATFSHNNTVCTYVRRRRIGLVVFPHFVFVFPQLDVMMLNMIFLYRRYDVTTLNMIFHIKTMTSRG